MKQRILAISLSLASIASMSAFAAGSDSKINGWISDSSCGAKHLGDDADCVKGCIKGGGKPVFVDEAKKQVWAIDNPDSVKNVYGKHVAITATADAASKSVHVDSVTVIGE